VDELIEDSGHLGSRLRAVCGFGDVQGGLVAGTHYAAFLDEHETVVAAELDFLRRHLLQDDPGRGEAAPA
jgi:hypothetical protein